MNKGVIITGASGGIGSGLTKAFKAEGWTVIATSRKEPLASDAEHIDHFFPCDLAGLAVDDAILDGFHADVKAALGDVPVAAIVNNAAVQILGGTASLSAADMSKSFNVNTLAPLRLVQSFLEDLKSEKGSVLNIGTVHAQSTKAGFVAYATTKTAMHGLTRALAVDLGPDIRVNTLAPAATETPMLKAGFEGKPEAYEALAMAHPLGRIAQVEEIANTAVFLCSAKASFISGATIYADGGVLSRLHDPA